jgi:alanine racemase
VQQIVLCVQHDAITCNIESMIIPRSSYISEEECRIIEQMSSNASKGLLTEPYLMDYARNAIAAYGIQIENAHEHKDQDSKNAVRYVQHQNFLF